MYTLIDVDDLEKVKAFKYTWCASYNFSTKSYYAYVTTYPKDENGVLGRGRLSLHRFLMNPNNTPGIQIDHINHDTLDNRKSNLRITNAGENFRNRTRKNSNNTSGYRNVIWNKSSGKWSVVICKDYKQIHLGSYDDVDEAGRVAEEARKQYYGEYLGGN